MASTDPTVRAFWLDVLKLPIRILACGAAIIVLVLLWNWIIGSSSALSPNTSWDQIIVGTLVFAAAVGLVIFLWWLAARFFKLIDLGRIPDSTVDAIKDLPMGLPEGTIRAILALVVAVVGLPLLLFQGVLELDPPIAGYMNGIIAGVFGFYFGTRTSGVPARAVAQITEAHQAILQKTDEVGAARVQTAKAEGQVEVEKAKAQTAKIEETDELKRKRDAGGFDTTLSTIERHLVLADTILKTFASRLPEGVLPANTAEILADAEKTVASLRGVTTATATQEQVDELSKLAELLTGGASPVAALMKAAAPLFAEVSPIPGLGPIASLVLLLGLGAKLGSSQYQRWRARVLAAPVGQGLVDFGAITPEVIAAALRNSPILGDALASRPQEEKKSVLANVMASPDAAQKLLAEYGPQGSSTPGLITDLEHAQAAVAELGRALLPLYSAQDVDKTTVQQVTDALSSPSLPDLATNDAQRIFRSLSPSAANQLVDAAAGISTRGDLSRAQRGAFDALVMLVDAARQQNIDLVAALAELRQ